ncbi:2,3-diphosphoglycerate-dependent phosphoglycerate mutase [Umboniibacter marinipuniceus]|uniref:2,3-bisphosphoglycerate-dependent phosphoglycerate mutase n=1 Tax=Umboniibacter marinipuniceus TaxID=569599 RepID=A0A3M0A3N4_9GAMM|nr:2,3-diphosphoglycerate-dependent phosphoglycerate mutase [Umboniibacter marinipuniceus]RMA79430.1 phosphoglycerate mutase [Umboniibacter marinipuniceus]
MYQLVLVRHGQSTWNKENRFTGWKDVPLSERGLDEAKKAGQMLKAKGIEFDTVFTSVLRRAIITSNNILEEMDLSWLPVQRNYRLNERHYGGLQGLDKSETAAKHGEEQVLIWRRSFDTPPPAMSVDDPEHPCNDPRYAGLDARALPNAESLKCTIDRVLPYWHDAIAPALKAGKKPLVVAHGNSLRALVKYLENYSDEAIMGINIPTGMPLLYTLDENFQVVSSEYVGDPEEVAKLMAEVAAQGKAK